MLSANSLTFCSAKSYLRCAKLKPSDEGLPQKHCAGAILEFIVEVAPEGSIHPKGIVTSFDRIASRRIKQR